MKQGMESQTAVYVAMGRAMAHGTTSATRFTDPTALALLPEDARRQVERARTGTPPSGLRERLSRALLRQRSKGMVVRTIAIDDAVRGAPSEQLVILGAGLDGRAWRMPELRDVIVFEVDHPDSQRAKRARAGALEPAARDIRFLPVDFARDSLDDALAGAGHDPTRPTTWIWEGVVMYLTVEEIEATLAVIERRSAVSSRLIVAYHSPALLLWVVGPLVRRVGEPLKSTFQPDAMRALLAEHGFAVVSDEALPTVAKRLPEDFARAATVVKHMRIVAADRRPTAAG
jgi:methyltransferase (TIGR00027 family)